MSRPSSYHDPERYHSLNEEYDGGFSLPLFNPAPPVISAHPAHRQPSEGASIGAGQIPPPSTQLHPHRHSIHLPSTYAQPPNGNGHGNGGGIASGIRARVSPPRSAGAVPPPSSRPPAAMTSTLPYAVPFPQSHGGRNQEELLLPPPTSTSLGALARSASLGARKKDPYAYSSDDVESGMGSMDMRGESSWAGYGRGGEGGEAAQLGMPRYGDVEMSLPVSPGARPPASQRSHAQMGPPPMPAASTSLAKPATTRNDSSGSSPSRPTYQTAQHNNPYLPRGSEAGPSSQPHWSEYRGPPATTARQPSSASYHSPGSDQLSPYMSADPSGRSPPLLNPYSNTSPGLGTGQSMPPSPNRSGQPHWSTSNAQANASVNANPQPILRAPSPSAYRPASQATRSQSSHQIYPASQPVTPAGKTFDVGPPRNLPSRDGRVRNSTSRQGFREVREWTDLRPRVNEYPAGRRADPNSPGKYLSPLKCLTQALPATYTLCNPQFRYESTDNPRRVLTKPSKPTHNDGADNEDWDYILYVNDLLGGEHGGDRYLILDVLGQGTFGQVVKCQNMRTHDICAVKVVKNKPAYLNQSKMEVAILDLLNHTYDPGDQHHILRMLESFTHKNHLCLVFECLSSNLYELIKQNQFKGLSTQLVKVFTQQLLECLAVLQDARLIHCDLKPENILLKTLQSPQIKVIDFGSACHEMQTVYTYIQSRFYRSPEVLLGLPYSTSIDMWSLGCIVVELFLGLPLFPGTSEYNQVSRIVDMLGLPPQHLLEVGKQTNEFFHFVGVDAQGRKQYQLKSMEQYAREHRTTEQPSKQYFKQTKLKEIIMEYPFSKKNAKQSDIDKEMANRRAFVDFVEGLLSLDPIKRWSPLQAAKHPFITGEKFTGSFQPPSVPSKKSYSNPVVEPPSTPSLKKYGGLVQSPTAARQQRIYSDAAAYNQQLAQHQSYTAQVQTAQNAARPGPFSPGYDPQQAYGHRHRQSSQSHGPPPPPGQGQWQPMGPPQNYQQRIPSQNMVSSSHAPSRNNQHMPNSAAAAATNPPPNSYYPPSRNRANTINQMDAIPPALARLTHFGVQDPSGTRNLTPVMNRDDAMREWERRHQGGHSKKSSMHTTSYPQLEYLQEQAELAVMGGSGWMMPGQYQPPASHHRSKPSTGGGQAYQMQPHISVSPTNHTGPSDYRARPQPSEYDPPPSAGMGSSSRSYLPAFPPPAATSTSNPPSATFDAFDARDTSMGLMYTPLQPSQAGYPSPGGVYGGGPGSAGGGGSGHQSRASFSGPYGPGTSQNPFAQQQQQPASPRYQRRSGQYGV